MNHWSDCATNNGPDGPVGPCDCGASAPGRVDEYNYDEWYAACRKLSPGIPQVEFDERFERTWDALQRAKAARRLTIN
jgi:hypothetical protein